MTFGANLVLAALLALGMPTQDLPATGSLALGLEFAAAGWVSAAVGAVAAQLTSSAGGARGIAVGGAGRGLPVTHVPKFPGGAVAAVPLVVPAAVAVVLTTAGLVGLRRRDMPATP